MFTSNRTKPLPLFLDSISDLCGLLWQGKKAYEQAAAALPDNALRRTILTLAQESNQYACELCAQLRTLGRKAPDEKAYASGIRTNRFRDSNAVLRFCQRKEKRIVNAYGKLLKKAAVHEGVQNMIRYQLNGMRNAFVQIQLLSSLRFQ